MSEEELREEIKNMLSWGHAHEYDRLMKEARSDGWERGVEDMAEAWENDGIAINPYQQEAK